MRSIYPKYLTQAEKNKIYRQTHREQRKEYQKKWDQNNPEKARAARRRWKSKYYAGITPKQSQWGYKKQLGVWSKKVREINNNVCVVCPKKSIHAHHIIHKKDYPELSLLINNGVGLCITHHNEVHGRFN